MWTPERQIVVWPAAGLQAFAAYHQGPNTRPHATLLAGLAIRDRRRLFQVLQIEIQCQIDIGFTDFPIH